MLVYDLIFKVSFISQILDEFYSRKASNKQANKDTRDNGGDLIDV